MKFITYETRAEQARATAEMIARDLSNELEAHDNISFSVTGGSTPGPVFDLLSKSSVAWDRVAVLLNDERWVDERSDRSNTRLVKSRLLQDRASRSRYIPLYLQHESPEDCLNELAEGIRPHLPLNCLLLGMGGDMHTASLFPGADRLDEALSDNAPIVLPMRADAAGEPRITLTAPVLKAAHNIHVLITGAEKHRAIHAAEQLTAQEAPISIILDRATVHWAE